MNGISPGLYKHFKGASYHVFTTIRHSETEELLVLYAPAASPDDLWARPLDMFCAEVDTGNGVQARFQFIRKFKSNDKATASTETGKQSLFYRLKSKITG